MNMRRPEKLSSLHTAQIAELNVALESTDCLAGRIQACTGKYSGQIAFSTSLGIEDQAVLHGIARAECDIDVFTLDTGRLFPETLDTIAASEERYGIRIRVVVPATRDVERLVNEQGVFGFRQSIEGRKSCCDARKVKPLRRALSKADGWMTGLRREQSPQRARVPYAEFDHVLDLVKINPIADWSLDQLEAFVEAHDIPVNPLHAKGFPSIGCQPCTRAVSPGEDMRAGRWWWERDTGADGHKECGLHPNYFEGKGDAAHDDRTLPSGRA